MDPRRATSSISSSDAKPRASAEPLERLAHEREDAVAVGALRAVLEREREHRLDRPTSSPR